MWQCWIFYLLHIHEDFHLERGNTCASLNLSSITGAVSEEATCTHFIQERCHLAWWIVVCHPGRVFVQSVKPGDALCKFVKCDSVTDLTWQNSTLMQQAPGDKQACPDSILILDISPISARKQISEYLRLYLKSQIQSLIKSSPFSSSASARYN